jgi:uncharacterized membrane protein (Fun14 family)
MDKDSWIILAAFATIVLGVLIYLAATGTIPIDWNSIFNIKTYPKN